MRIAWLQLVDSLALAMVVPGLSGLVLVWRTPRGPRRVPAMLGIPLSSAMLAWFVAG